MPLFDFECKICGNIFEVLLSNSKEDVHCPKCSGIPQRIYKRGLVYKDKSVKRSAPIGRMTGDHVYGDLKDPNYRGPLP